MKDDVQYHLQFSGVDYKQGTNEEYVHDICEKYSANSIPRECIDASQEFLIVSCSALGELDYKNKSNQFNLNDDCRHPTTNGMLQIHLNDQDNQLFSNLCIGNNIAV